MCFPTANILVSNCCALHYFVMSRYELQRGVSTTSSQLDETEQPDTTALEDGDNLSHKEVGCSVNSSRTTGHSLFADFTLPWDCPDLHK